MQSVVFKSVGLVEMATLIEESPAQQSVDTGSTIVVALDHPKFGSLTIINSAMDENATVMLSSEFASEFAIEFC